MNATTTATPAPASDAVDLKYMLSLWQPWASVVACGDKLLENRPRPPPLKLLGQRIWLHAAKYHERGAAHVLPAMYAWMQSGGHERLVQKGTTALKGAKTRQYERSHFPEGVVLGHARIVGWIDLRPDYSPSFTTKAAPGVGDFHRRLIEELFDVIQYEHTPTPKSVALRRWWMGPVGIVLDEVTALEVPLHCSGGQGYRFVPAWALPQLAVARKKEPVLLSRS